MQQYEVRKQFSFEAAHSLPHLPDGHKCQSVHGHSYSLVVACRGELDKRGFVVDYAEISEAVRPLIDRIDHAYISGSDEDARGNGKTCVIAGPYSSAEFIAQWFFDCLAEHLPTLHHVELYETASTVVVYPCS